MCVRACLASVVRCGCAIRALTNRVDVGIVLPMKTLATIFKGLSDPIRLRILALMLCNDELCVCDVMEALRLPQSSTSRHLAYLKRCGWLMSRRSGVWIYYRLSNTPENVFPELLGFLKGRFASAEDIRVDREHLSLFMIDKNRCSHD